ncbi:SAM-dependent DNA methyltransferase, partial [Candidatus Poribacteria bacterium]|nr:SAM-dependent DNA methyltransferase [Candidatus Poribacteria bacterium]
PETPEQNDIPDLLQQWGAYKASGFKAPPGVEGGTLLEPGSEDARCWWVSIKTLASNDYNLAAGRYKPQITEAAPDEDPAELIREVLAMEREIVTGLETLLEEVES